MKNSESTLSFIENTISLSKEHFFIRVLFVSLYLSHKQRLFNIVMFIQLVSSTFDETTERYRCVIVN